MAAPFGPQPNFNLISDEIKKAQNLPAITNGQQILAEIQGVRQELAGVRTDLTGVHEDITAIRQDIIGIREEMSTRAFTFNHNNLARVQNTYVTSRTGHLTPFLNPVNRAAIHNFPNTSAELGQMTRQQLDSVLRQLDLRPDEGASVAEMRKMLRCHIGLREVAGQAPP